MTTPFEPERSYPRTWPSLAADDQALLEKLKTYDDSLTRAATSANEITRHTLKAHANKALEELEPLLKTHEIPLVAFPKGLDHFIVQVRNGRRHTLTAESLTAKFAEEYTTHLTLPAQPVEALFTGSSASYERTEAKAEELAGKLGGMGKWLAGGIIVAAVAIGAFIALKKNKANQVAEQKNASASPVSGLQ